MTFPHALSFDDVLLVPQTSNVMHRNDVSLQCDDWCMIPLVSAPMDTVFSLESARILLQSGCMVCIPRYNSIEEEVSLFKELDHFVLNVQKFSGEKQMQSLFASIGATGDFLERAEALYEAGCGNFLIDIAHGDHILMKKALQALKEKHYGAYTIMAGNVATASAFCNLAEWGADIVRVGVAGGAVCTTKFVTGHSVPTFQSILDCHNERLIDFPEVLICADGGIKNSGDAVKAFAAGADFVMLGNLFAGHEESPGNVIEINGKPFKEFRGMASAKSQTLWRNHVSVEEGTSTLIPLKGTIRDTIDQLRKGIQSGCSYSGVSNLSDLKKYAQFITVSANHSAGQHGS